jgi:heme/copper-type cytochrome/quinol oxidase subunit 2
MNKKMKWVIMIIGTIAIIFLLVIVFLEIQSKVKKANLQTTANEDVPENSLVVENEDKQTPENDFEETEFRKQVPGGVKVPMPGEIIPDELKDIVAVPEEFLGPKDGSQEGSGVAIFSVKGEGGKFIPSQIIINYNDIVKINISAVDADYDFTLKGYNMKQTIKMGETKSLGLQALKEGRFLFYCDVCGGVESEAKGEIVVVK